MTTDRQRHARHPGMAFSMSWQGILPWFVEMLVRENMELMQVVNSPKEVVDAIFRCYEKRRFEPSA
jgi:hypothetical protein